MMDKEKEKIEILVSKKACLHGVELGKKIYLGKVKKSNGFYRGSANELQADIYGFAAKAVICEFFESPLPSFEPSNVKKYDLLSGDKKIVVKKVGFSRFTKQPKVTINKRQYSFKKDYVDAFLFCTFTGGLQQVSAGVGDYQIFIPLPIFSKLWLLGWLKSDEVEKIGRTHIWKDNNGKASGESWDFKQLQLRPMETLLTEAQMKKLRGKNI